MITQLSRIEILRNQVDCRNKVNYEAAKLAGELKQVFTEFSGKKIVKFSGYKSLCESVRKKIEPIVAQYSTNELSGHFEVMLSSVYYSLRGSYKTSDVSVGYCKREFFVAGFDKDTGVMTEEIRSLGEFRADYTAEEVLEVQARISVLEDEIGALKHKIYEFK